MNEWAQIKIIKCRALKNDIRRACHFQVASTAHFSRAAMADVTSMQDLYRLLVVVVVDLTSDQPVPLWHKPENVARRHLTLMQQGSRKPFVVVVVERLVGGCPTPPGRGTNGVDNVIHGIHGPIRRIHGSIWTDH